MDNLLVAICVICIIGADILIGNEFIEYRKPSIIYKNTKLNTATCIIICIFLHIIFPYYIIIFLATVGRKS